MGQIKNVAIAISSLFPTSGTVISQKLTAEEMLLFAIDVQEIDTRIEAQLNGNSTVKADYDAEKLRADNMVATMATLKAEYEGKMTEAATASMAKLTEVEGQLVALKPYQDFADRMKAQGKALPTEDANSRNDANPFAHLSAGHPDRLRAENLARQQKVK